LKKKHLHSLPTFSQDTFFLVLRRPALKHIWRKGGWESREQFNFTINKKRNEEKFVLVFVAMQPHYYSLETWFWWIADGFELSNTNRHTPFANGTLVLYSGNKLHDEGYYKCTAFGDRDEPHSGTIQVKILSKNYDGCLVDKVLKLFFIGSLLCKLTLVCLEFIYHQHQVERDCSGFVDTQNWLESMQTQEFIYSILRATLCCIVKKMSKFPFTKEAVTYEIFEKTINLCKKKWFFFS